KEVFSFVYKAPFDNGLTEHELDHVMVGAFEEAPEINIEEVQSYKWMPLEAVKKDIEKSPEIYTEWFKIIFKESYQKLKNA
ncbi:MAG: NUDIX domain-containing protein, partial [Polaribacter sp.]